MGSKKEREGAPCTRRWKVVELHLVFGWVKENDKSLGKKEEILQKHGHVKEVRGPRG